MIGRTDETWLADAGRNHWIVLMKDDRIRYRPAELQALAADGRRALQPSGRLSVTA